MLNFIDLKSGCETLRPDTSVLCLGNFDGVHAGHSVLIESTENKCRELRKSDPNILGGAWCFRQPPADFLSVASHPLLTTVDEKLELFAKKGLDIAILGDFPELMSLSPNDFINEILIKQCGCVFAVCGYNFRFGKNAAGTGNDLNIFKFGSLICDAVSLNGEAVSSSAVRREIETGNVEKANSMLGREYSFTAEIKHGKALGRELGFPTVNQFIPACKAVPKNGVYAVCVLIDGITYKGIANIGNNPTFNNEITHCETHIFDFNSDLYGKTVKISFYKRLRDEIKFANAEELKNAVELDIVAARRFFLNNSI